MSIPISVIIVTKNAASTLQACLKPLKDFSQVIVVDSMSTDKTKLIVKKYNCEYIPYEWNGRYPKKRQWCLDNLVLKHDWVFFVDADEVISERLKTEISELFHSDPPLAGYFVTGQYVWNGKLLKHGLQNRKIALFNRRRMKFPEVNDLDCPGMGEIEGHYQPVLKRGGYMIGTLQNSLFHYANHSKEGWLTRHKGYASWEIAMNRKNAWPQDPIFNREKMKKSLRTSPLKPELAFLHSYILKGGYLDGAAGYDFAKSRWLYYDMIRKGDGQ